MNETKKNKRARIDFGKINYNGTGFRYSAIVEIELRDCEESGEHYAELSICGEIGRSCGGQCLDRMLPHLKNNSTFKSLYYLWKNYHLNGANAGTPEQELAIDKWLQNNRYDYTEACEYLKSIGLYEVNYSGLAVGGKRYNNEPYKYGTAWLIRELPAAALELAENIIKNANQN